MMSSEIDYIEINKQTWNNKTDVHIASDFYDVENFLKGKSSLNEIELELLGDIKGKTILHLQCHFGQDSLSLARMGAKVTGVDLSDKAINKAKEFNETLGLDAKFICCDIYDTPKLLDEKFDIVFASYGTIGWFPDLTKWANIISQFLKPQGKFVFADFHPIVWIFDDNFENIFYSYFNINPIIENETGTYADKNANIYNQTITWNHPISEVFNALAKSGLNINVFKEYNYSPYDCFNETEEYEKGKYRIKHLKNKIPLVYSIVAIKK